MCEFFGCDCCVLLTVNMLCHVEVMFIQLLNLLERHYVYLHLFIWKQKGRCVDLLEMSHSVGNVTIFMSAVKYM